MAQTHSCTNEALAFTSSLSLQSSPNAYGHLRVVGNYLAIFNQPRQHDQNWWSLVPNHLNEIGDGNRVWT